MMKKALLSLLMAFVCLPTVFAQNLPGHSVKVDSVTSCQVYTWPRNNQTYSTDTVVLYSTADTTFVLNFTKLSTYIDTTTAIELQGSCSVTWNSQEWTTMGTFLDTLVSTGGCDSIVKINVTLASIDTVRTIETCGSFTAPWGDVYTASRTIDTTITDGSCTYHNVINLTISPEYLNLPIEEVTAGCVYQWGNVPIADYEIHVKNLKTVVGQCDSVIRLRVTAFNGQQYDTTQVVACDSYTPTWSSAITTSGLYVHDSTYGTYPVSATETAACQHHDAYEVTIVTSISDSTNLEPTIINASCSYTWNGHVYTDTNTHYHLYSSVIGNCDSMAGIKIVYSGQEYDTTFARQCGDSYNWKTSNPTLPLPGAASQYLFTTDTVYTVSIEDTVHGCTHNYTLSLTFYDKADTLDQYYCGNSYNYTYRSYNSTTNSWTNATATFTAPGYYTTNPENGEYLISIASGCKTYRTLNLDLNIPEQRFRADSIDTTVCERFRFRADRRYGSWLTLTQSCDEDIIHEEHKQNNIERCYDSIVHVKLVVNHNTIINQSATVCDSYTWSDFDGNTYTETSIYRDTLDERDANGCLQIGTLNLTVYKTPVIDIVGEWMLQPGESTVLHAVPTEDSDPISSYKWYINDELRSSTDSLELTVNHNTDVRLESTARHGSTLSCTAINWITVTANVGIDDVETLQVNIYPNPASRYINIESAAAMDEVILFNALGQQVINRQANGNSMQLDLGNYAAGTYMLRINGADGSQTTRKIVINR